MLLSGGEAIPFDPVTIIEAFGAPLAIAIFLSVMATNTMVMYGMTLSLTNAMPTRKPLRFLPTALAVGVVAIIGSTFLGLLEQFVVFLSIIGALFIPVFAIMVVDYYLVRGRAYTPDILVRTGGRYWFTGGVHWAAIVSWAIGALTYLAFLYWWSSPVGAALPTFAIAFLLYWVSARATRVGAGEAVESRHLAEVEGAQS